MTELHSYRIGPAAPVEEWHKQEFTPVRTYVERVQLGDNDQPVPLYSVEVLP